MARVESEYAIGLGGPEAVLQAMNELKPLLQDKEAKVRRYAAGAVGKGGPEAVHQVMDELRALLQDESAGVRQRAGGAIGRGGPEAVLQAVGELKELLQETSSRVRQWAAWTIGKGGPEAVFRAREELEVLLDDPEGAIRESAARSLSHGGADVIAEATAHIRPSLDLGNYPRKITNATEVVSILGPAAIEGILPALQLVLRRDVTRSGQTAARLQQMTIAAAAIALRGYFASRPMFLHTDLARDLERAHYNLHHFVSSQPNWGELGAVREVENALHAFGVLVEGRCMPLLQAQVGELLLVRSGAVTTPTGYMVESAANAALSDHGLRAHKCPHIGACPGEVANVTYTNSTDVTCPLARSGGAGAPCSKGYDGNVAGCAGCIGGWGRSPTDAFTCQRCGIAWVQWAVWLAHPSSLLAISLRSAKRAAALGDAAAFANDVLKIALSFSSSSAVIISALASSATYRNLNEQTRTWLTWTSYPAQAGEATWSSSADCLLGWTLSLRQMLLLALANPLIVLAATCFVLGFLHIVRRRQGMSSCFTEDLMTVVVVAGNQYLPSVAAACAIAAPCYHTQTGEDASEDLLVYSTRESCHQRMSYMVTRAPVLTLAFAAGPALWRWLLHRAGKDGSEQCLRFLTASYRPEHAGWEANRLTKNMLLKCAVAVAPTTYCPVRQLILVLCPMLAFTTWHFRMNPYRFNLLNSVEATSLWVLNLCMLASCYAVSESWSLTSDFAEQLVIGVYCVLAINGVGLFSLLIWAKVGLYDGHPMFQEA
ncbi:unnamed protein product [Prorocentrum cordatum]|uniref:Uncharacterized protein n=1 Tax=Prorocentrum cordatum TaxID=2364126 RepID=A0ABN9TRT0_9DINO|nr:unnamed protein product [Polarella glacialis]